MTPTIGRNIASLSFAHIPIDVKKLIAGRCLIQGNSGAGKSHTVRRIAEQTHGLAQHLIIDPDGEYATLRERFPYVLAAKHGGDCVADPRSAAMLAHKLLEIGASAILDLYELKAHERILFVRNFLDAVVNAPKSLWHPTLVFVDEAHIFCPQAGSAESSGAVIDLATRGRKRGYGIIVATQRISKLHKDVAAECNNKLIGRAALDVDMKRCADELGFSGRDDQHSLRRLKPGNFYAFGPALSDDVTLVQVGEVKTSHPKAGKRATKTPPPPGAIRKVLAQLADIPKEADEEIKNLAEARAKIRELERQLKQKPAPQVERIVEKAKQPLMSDKAVKRVVDAMSRFEVAARSAVAAVEEVHTARKEWAKRELGQSLKNLANVERSEKAARELQRDVNAQVRPPAEAASLTPGKRRILDAIAWWGVLGKETPTRLQVSLKLGVGVTSGGFTNNLGALKTAGLIDYPSAGLLKLTPAGDVHALHNAAASLDDLHKAVEDFVTPAQWRILSMLMEESHAMSRQDLADRFDVGVTSGGFTNNLGRLHTLELITYPKKGYVQAAPVLFGQ